MSNCTCKQKYMSAQACTVHVRKNVILSTLKVLFFLVWVLLGKSGKLKTRKGGWLNLKPKSRKVAVQSLLCDVLSLGPAVRAQRGKLLKWICGCRGTRPNHYQHKC